METEKAEEKEKGYVRVSALSLFLIQVSSLSLLWHFTFPSSSYSSSPLSPSRHGRCITSQWEEQYCRWCSCGCYSLIFFSNNLSWHERPRNDPLSCPLLPLTTTSHDMDGQRKTHIPCFLSPTTSLSPFSPSLISCSSTCPECSSLSQSRHVWVRTCRFLCCG